MRAGCCNAPNDRRGAAAAIAWLTHPRSIAAAPASYAWVLHGIGLAMDAHGRSSTGRGSGIGDVLLRPSNRIQGVAMGRSDSLLAGTATPALSGCPHM
jgi:hypothetical protein